MEMEAGSYHNGREYTLWGMCGRQQLPRLGDRELLGVGNSVLNDA